MKLFLASQDLGESAEVLRGMVGDRKRAFVISNARDYYADEVKIARDTEKTLTNLANIGLQAERLDLRQYFGKQPELEELILRDDTGLIFAIGGNVFCLATALHASGLDEIIKRSVGEERFAYGGYSAGSMVASHDLTLYQLPVHPGEQQPLHRVAAVTHDIYNLAPHMQGLGLIPQYVIPHVGRADHIESTRERLAKIEQAGAETILLHDDEVFVIDGTRETVL